MKSKASGWLCLIAALGIAVVLFSPLYFIDPSLPFSQNLRQWDILSVLAWGLAAAGFWGFQHRFWRDSRNEPQFRNLVLLLLLQAALLRTVFEILAAYKLPWAWLPQDAWVWVPWFLGAGFTALLLGGRFGVLVCVAGALMLYLLTDSAPLPVIGCLTSTLVGILLLRRSPTRTRVLRAGAGTGAVLGLVAAAESTVNGAPVDAISAAVLVPFLLGLGSAFLVLAFLPVLEWLLGELSDISLIEYGTEHPLLDQLRAEAPGTWHHSVNVADLAEKAAAEIGARPLFCKTAALYHDVGKLKQPALFAENIDGPSPHERLQPHASAQKIIEHVSYGLELARKHRLPKPLRQIIAEHHGTSLVRFFYARACQPLPDGSQPNVNRALFSYPGPPPSTRESGIIALADAVEAATRSLSSRAESVVRPFVRKLLAERISEGELAQCPLTLADLAKVEAAFIGWLKGRDHFRPAYPAPAPELAAPVAKRARA